MNSRIRKIYKRFITPIIIIKPKNLLNYIHFAGDFIRYRNMDKTSMRLWPIIDEKTSVTSIDPHYFFQAIWAAKKIARLRPIEHLDVGSQAIFVGMLTAIIKVRFVDIRPIEAKLDNFQNNYGDILNLPFNDNSINSISCLHVAEHVGLGRYGDRLDPKGTEKACRELARILEPGGRLYFSVPIGKEVIFFNAHRVHHAETILNYFKNLKLVGFSAVDDRGRFIEDADISAFTNSNYSCGLFEFSK